MRFITHVNGVDADGVFYPEYELKTIKHKKINQLSKTNRHENGTIHRTITYLIRRITEDGKQQQLF